ncbi:BnaAnng04360D [Brassica napus]|uniref:BnaAnng04360D protein n=1 Tax=Brassica napus TaxID=3708 RepID=A0A078HCQ0_BRANA|nr:BnaAnng04360D [Brassica napus]
MGLGLILDSTKDDEPDPYTRGHSGYLITFSSILFVYVLTFYKYIRNWIRNIEQHASDNVNKILVGNKADMDESKKSAKTNLNVEEVFFLIAKDIKQRLTDTDSRAEDEKKCITGSFCDMLFISPSNRS